MKGGRLKHSGDDAFQVVCFGTAVSVQALFAGIRSVGLTAVGLALERLS